MWQTMWRIKYGLAASSIELTGLLLIWMTPWIALGVAYVIVGLALSLVADWDVSLRKLARR